MAIRFNVQRNDFGKIGSAVSGKSSQVVRKTTLDIHGLAVETSPYDTRYMIGTHAAQFDDGGHTGAVIVGADYSAHVHEGHATVNGGYVAGRPWLAEAAEHHRPAFEAALSEVFEP